MNAGRLLAGNRVAACSLHAGRFLAVNQVAAGTAALATMALSGLALLLSRGRNLKPCDMCGGAGAWNCVICDGDGFLISSRTKSKCKACVGRGKRLCRRCDGSGWDKSSMYIG